MRPLLLALGALVLSAGISGRVARAQQWLSLDGPVSSGRGAAYDTGRGRLVAFGSDGGTWEWDGGQWFQRPTVTSPPRRRNHVMVYDAQRRHTLLFGGSTMAQLPTILSDTWAWDGVEWRQLFSVAQPPAAASPTVAYDERRGRVVVQAAREVWEHDGLQWLQVTPTNPLGPVSGLCMAFDSVRGVTLLFGVGTGSQLLLWQWDGIGWSQLASPPAVGAWSILTGAAFDRARQRLVVYGATLLQRTLEWDGTAWTQFATPLARAGHAMFFDPRRQQVVLYAGANDPYQFSDQWAWNGSTWSQVAPERRPFPRTEVAMDRDPVTGTMLMFGGGELINAYDDTWRWDGQRWQFLAVTPRPASRRGAATCVDPTTGRLALFGGWNAGGLFNDLWHWDGAAWSAAATAVRPTVRRHAAMAGDTARSRVVLFGGLSATTVLGDTWEWDGTAWRQVGPVAPSARMQPAMAYDPTRNRVVLYGGSTAPPTQAAWVDDSWEWDGTTWRQTQGTRPSVLTTPAATFDASRGRVLLVGGGLSGIGFEAWEFDGAGWSQLSVQGPGPGPSMRLLHDPARGRNLVFDGSMLMELSTTPAEALSYGSGCGPAPVLAARARPRTGEPAFGLETAVQPAHAVLFALAFASGTAPLGNGCMLLLQQPLATVLSVADNFGLAVQPIPLPPNHALRGLLLFAQAGVLSPAAPGGFALSQGLRLAVGD